jgi:excisionase family DNA binding protein
MQCWRRRRWQLFTSETFQRGYLSIENAAAYADVSVKTIKRWIKAGLPVYQGGARGKVLIRPSDIDAYLTRKQAPQIDLNAMVEEVIKDLNSGPKAA